MTKLNIKTTDELKTQIESLKTQAIEAAATNGEKMEVSVTINGKSVRVTSTPQARSTHRPYTVVYVDDKRKSKETLASVLL